MLAAALSYTIRSDARTCLNQWHFDKNYDAFYGRHVVPLRGFYPSVGIACRARANLPSG